VAVFERTFKIYDGERTPENSRFLVLPRYAYKEVLKSKILIIAMTAWLLWSLVLAILLYVPHNSSVLKLFQAEASFLLSLPVFRGDATWFFGWLMAPASIACFILAVLVGPTLISTDLRNNGLPLYLARPISRTEYILGKSAVLVILLSVISWIPGLLLFGFQSYLMGWEWFTENIRIGPAIFFSFWAWILVLCLLSLAVSAYVKFKPIAMATLFAIFFMTGVFGGFIDVMLISQNVSTPWGSLVNIAQMMTVVWGRFFGVEVPFAVPLPAALASLGTVCALCLWLLSRKVRAYEIVR
jgi:ABC-2 type transport system permease protein